MTGYDKAGGGVDIVAAGNNGEAIWDKYCSIEEAWLAGNVGKMALIYIIVWVYLWLNKVF